MTEMPNHLEGEEIDQEWLYLILEAKKIGLSMEEIRSFLRQESPKRCEKPTG